MYNASDFKFIIAIVVASIVTAIFEMIYRPARRNKPVKRSRRIIVQCVTTFAALLLMDWAMGFFGAPITWIDVIDSFVLSLVEIPFILAQTKK